MARTPHDDAEEQTDPYAYRCTECGKEYDNIGRLHVHAEKHRGLFGLQLPWKIGDYEALMDMTEVVTKDD